MDTKEAEQELGVPVEQWQKNEASGAASATRLNWLRAGVLGANDGVVSTTGLVLGVAGANASTRAILVAGVAGLVSGSLSMGVGEYVSVSTQRDAQESMLRKERAELISDPEGELDELTDMYEAKGISHDLARQVAIELTAHDALAAHAEVELGLDPEELTSPWHAAFASMVSFAFGALIPLLLITLVGESARVIATGVAAIIALAVTGFGSARLGKSPTRAATIRNILGGLVAISVTYMIGHFIA